MALKSWWYKVVVLGIGILLIACDKAGTGYPVGSWGEGDIEALILNEGTINTNMGDISVIYRNGVVVPNIFRDVNGRPMGDVAQSITKINGYYFVALNNSRKVEIIEPGTFKSVATILYTQAGYPRQIVPITESEAIVSDLNQQLVRIRTMPPFTEPLEYIPVPQWIEYMVVENNKLFGITANGLFVFDINNINKESARIIHDVRNDESTKTCKMLVDKSQKIWVCMNELEAGKITGISFSCIDTHTERVVKKYVLPIRSTHPQAGEVIGVISHNRTDIDPTGTWIYFNAKTCPVDVTEKTSAGIQSVWRMNVDTGEFQHYRDLPDASMMYGFAVSPTGDVYICDCLDYTTQRGYIRKYLEDNSVESYRVGVYPSQVYFPR